MSKKRLFFIEPEQFDDNNVVRNPEKDVISAENGERMPEHDIDLADGTVALAYKNNSEPEPEITHFDPYLYGEYDEYDSSKSKPLSKMTLKDALLIVCGQARASDFYDEVVEQACQMIKDAHLIPPTKKD